MSSWYDERTDATYDRAGWGAAVTRGANPALVVIDLARGFTEKSFPAGADLTDVVQANTELMNIAHSRGLPVFITRIVYQESEILPGVTTWLTKATGMRDMLEGTEAVAMDPRLPIDPKLDVILEKREPQLFMARHLPLC